MAERTLTEQETFRAVRYFIEQFNEREKSESLMLWLSWKEQGDWPQDPLATSDPAQWRDWVKCVDRVLAERDGTGEILWRQGW